MATGEPTTLGPAPFPCPVMAVLAGTSVRDGDMAGRYGGEEFMLILPGTTNDRARMIADRIRVAIEKKFSDERVRVTISGGVMEYAGDCLDSFIHAADKNLFEAKHSGKNRVL